MAESSSSHEEGNSSHDEHSSHGNEDIKEEHSSHEEEHSSHEEEHSSHAEHSSHEEGHSSHDEHSSHGNEDSKSQSKSHEDHSSHAEEHSSHGNEDSKSQSKSHEDHSSHAEHSSHEEEHSSHAEHSSHEEEHSSHGSEEAHSSHGEGGEHDSHDHGSSHAHDPLSEIISEYDKDDNGVLTEREFKKLYKELVEDSDSGSGGGGGHEGHDHGRRDLRSLQAESSDEDSHCKDVEDLFDEYSKKGRIRSKELKKVLPELVLQRIEGCGDSSSSSGCGSQTAAQAWGYGLLSALIVSLISLVCVLIIPVKNKVFKKILLECMLSFAVGALLGDALLHLLPGAYGVHGHSGEEEEEEDDLKPVWIGCVAVAGVLAFWLIERILRAIHRKYHKGGNADPSEESANANLENAGEKRSLRHIAAVGWLNLIADAVHNIVDGFALGAAWSASNTTGLSTTIAICFHEIPQELGDFAILIYAGFSKWQAVFLNVCVNFTSLLGVVIGLAIGTSIKDSEEWLLAFAAGTFLYIALADMLPELQKIHGAAHTVMQLTCACLGVTVMIILSIFEPHDDCA